MTRHYSTGGIIETSVAHSSTDSVFFTPYSAGGKKMCGLWHIPVRTWHRILRTCEVHARTLPFIWGRRQWVLLSELNRRGTTWPCDSSTNTTQHEIETQTVLSNSMSFWLLMAMCNNKKDNSLSSCVFWLRVGQENQKTSVYLLGLAYHSVKIKQTT